MCNYLTHNDTLWSQVQGFHRTELAALMSGLIFFSSQMWAFYALWITAGQWRWFLVAGNNRKIADSV